MVAMMEVGKLLAFNVNCVTLQARIFGVCVWRLVSNFEFAPS